MATASDNGDISNEPDIVTEDLFRLFDRLYRARSLNEIYRTALDGTIDALGCERAALLLGDQSGNLNFVDWRGLSDDYRIAVARHSPWRRGDRDAALICIEDVRRSNLGSLQEIIVRERIEAIAFVPLTSGDGVFGKLMAYYDRPHSFAPREKKAVLVIARQVGLAIERHYSEVASRRLSAIVTSSDDAIISKDLNGTIMTWNEGATRLFGHSAAEAIGQPITILIPIARQDEEPEILARIRAGQRIDHYETVRQHKNGHLLDISLTVSPIIDSDGQVIGASKIARDISERRSAQEQQKLLMQEMDHRVKNLFTLAGSIVRLSAGQAETAAELARIIVDRLDALARAHALTFAPVSASESALAPASLQALIEAILRPFAHGENGIRIFIRGEDAFPATKIITPLSLLLHEFATNSAKYGALSISAGVLEIDCLRLEDKMTVRWKERNGPPVSIPSVEGFGSRLVSSAARQVGHIERRFEPDGVLIEIGLAAECIADRDRED